MAKKNVKKIINKEENKNVFSPKNLAKLKMLVVIVKKGHGIAVNDLLLENGASMSTVIFAEGTKNKYVMDILGGEENDKECIMTIINENYYLNIKNVLKERFSISQASKGVLLCFDVDSMAGVLAYKFLADFQGAKKYGK